MPMYLSSDFEKISTNEEENVSHFKSDYSICEQFINPVGLL